MAFHPIKKCALSPIYNRHDCRCMGPFQHLRRVNQCILYLKIYGKETHWLKVIISTAIKPYRVNTPHKAEKDLRIQISLYTLCESEPKLWRFPEITSFLKLIFPTNIHLRFNIIESNIISVPGPKKLYYYMTARFPRFWLADRLKT